jgi:hypothetical protein
LLRLATALFQMLGQANVEALSEIKATNTVVTRTTTSRKHATWGLPVRTLWA